MPTHINTRYEEIESLWGGIEQFQELARQYKVNNIFQDSGGKMVQIAIATGLDLCEERTGPDATDRMGNFYEIKTTDIAQGTGGFSTNHHLNHGTISRFRSRRFVFAIFHNITLQEIYRVEGAALDDYYSTWLNKLAQPNTQHLNNPKISISDVRKRGTVMYLKDVPPDWAQHKQAA